MVVWSGCGGRRRSVRDMAEVVVPSEGSLQTTGNPWQPMSLIDPAGAPVESVAAYFRDLQARGCSDATVRSYGMDLLRWFRFLWAVGMSGTGRLGSRPVTSLAGCSWRVSRRVRTGDVRGRAAGAVAAIVRGGPYAASVRAHSETVLRGFYDFHRRRAAARCEPVPAGPVATQRPRACASQSDGAATATSGPGCTGPRCPSRIPRSITDEEFNEIFARLPSHRDRALVAFYVSTGARAAELLSVTAAASTRAGS